MKYLCALLFCVLPFLSFAQHEDCDLVDTPNPSFSHAHLKNTLRHLASEPEKNLQILPIWAHILRPSDGQDAFADIADIEQVIADANVFFAEVDIVLELCNWSYIDDSSLYYTTLSSNDIEIRKNNRAGMINLYCIENYSSCGTSSFPWSQRDFINIKNNCLLNGSTFIHEFGHYLGLWHTHTTTNGYELVNGSNCEQAGDLICDTPADPRLSSENVSFSCNYTGDEVDNNGDNYMPDARNIMSYSRKYCRDVFSAQQYEFMKYYALVDRTYLSCYTDDTHIGDVSIQRLGVQENGVADNAYQLNCIQRYSGAIENEIAIGIGFYLSVDSLYDEQDILLGQNTSFFTPSFIYEYEEVYITIPNDIPSGKYYILAVADNQNALVEINENNNTAFVSIEIEGLDTLSVQAFNVQESGCELLLDWTIYSDHQALNYELEYSADNENYYLLEQIQAQAQSIATYAYRHHFIAGELFFRTKINLVDGSFLYTDTISASLAEQCSLPVSIYPNPVQRNGFLNIVNINDDTQIEVYDMQGRLLLDMSNQLTRIRPYHYRLNTSGLAAAVYMLMLTGYEQKTFPFIVLD